MAIDCLTSGKVLLNKHSIIPGDALHYLKTAALMPKLRGEMIARALEELLGFLPAVGTALIWPCQDRKIPWKVYYAGMNRESMQPWLRARLNTSLDATFGVLQQDLSRLSAMPNPQMIYLETACRVTGGLWIIWSPLPQAGLPMRLLEEVRRMLEALIEVECLEERYFSSASPLSDQTLIEALAYGDSQAILSVLCLTRLAGNADLTFWGRVYQNSIETCEHMKARQADFGFVLQRQQGIGVTLDHPITIEDYRNSLYRRSDAAALDDEGVRSMIVLPVRSSEQIAGVLYATRRTVKPFSLAEQLLLQRMTSLLEPLPEVAHSSSFLSPGLPPAPDPKTGWQKLLLHANHIEKLEAWMSKFIKGTIIVTDSDGHPYVLANREQLNHLQTAFENSMDGVQVLSLKTPETSLPGQVYLRSSLVLPPPKWPDFFADLVEGCNVVIGRMEQARDHLAREREQWLQALQQEKILPHVRQEGYRLGLPGGRGQLWVIAWPSQQLLARQMAQRRMLAENIVLNQLECPLLFWKDDIGVILLDEHVDLHPSRLRDALLTQFAPDPLWIVYGARYRSLHDLKMLLTHSISQARKARQEAKSEYLLDSETPGLESLLANPRLTEDLRKFADRLLTPLVEYDKSKGTDLTTTFVLTQMLGSVQTVGDELGVHVNTIRYRLRKAEDILGAATTPQGRMERSLAAFVFQGVALRKLSPAAK